MRRLSYFPALFLTATMGSHLANAEETNTAEVLDTVSQISALYSSLEGKTISMTGAIGTLISDTLYLKNDDGKFKVQFDAGRAARKQIAGCELEFFGWANSDCIVDVDAEIMIEDKFSLADGVEITLIVYELERK